MEIDSPFPREAGVTTGARPASARVRPSRRSLLLAVIPAALLAKGKKTLHPRGFSFELPDRWKWELAEQGGVLLPPGVVVDPEREDNPEVYSIRVPDSQDAAAERAFIEDMRADLKRSKIVPDRGGDLENFSQPGLGGVVYTFDFVHPRQRAAYRIRVYAMSARGRLLFLVASGHRARIEAKDRVLREVARSITWR